MMQHPRQNSCTGIHNVHLATEGKLKTLWIISCFNHLASSVNRLQPKCTSGLVRDFLGDTTVTIDIDGHDLLLDWYRQLYLCACRDVNVHVSGYATLL